MKITGVIPFKLRMLDMPMDFTDKQPVAAIFAEGVLQFPDCYCFYCQQQ